MTFPTQAQRVSSPDQQPVDRPDGLVVVVLPLQIGSWALELMAAEGLPVSPVMACEQHNTVRVPVQAAAADTPLTEHLELASTLECTEVGGTSCPFRDWSVPPRTAVRVGVVTDYSGFCDSLQRVKRPRNARAA